MVKRQAGDEQPQRIGDRDAERGQSPAGQEDGEDDRETTYQPEAGVDDGGEPSDRDGAVTPSRSPGEQRTQGAEGRSTDQAGRDRQSTRDQCRQDSGSDALPERADALRVLGLWLAEDTWARSAEFFAAHSVALSSPDAVEALRNMAEAEPETSRLRAQVALLDLAAVGRVEAGFDYLTRIGRVERKNLLLEQARVGGDATTFAAFGALVAGVDDRFAQGASFSERAYADALRAIALVLADDVVSAVELAGKARRLLTSIPRVTFVLALESHASEPSRFSPGLRAVQAAFVICD